MKKVRNLFVLALVFFLAVSALYADSGVVEYRNNGIKLQYTSAFDSKNMKGVLVASANGYEDYLNAGTLTYLYFAMSPGEFQNMVYEAESGNVEVFENLLEKRGVLAQVISVQDGKESSPYYQALKTQYEMIQLARVEDVTFYACFPDVNEYLSEVSFIYKYEFNNLGKELLKVLQKATYSPIRAAGDGLIGMKVEFTTKDINGNTVTSQELFSKNKVTMINIWATWCGPCVRELSGLAELNQSLEKKGASIIGICTDFEDSSAACLNLLSKNGVKYLNILPYEGMNESLELQGYPTSIFVDSEGYILSAPVVGAPSLMSVYEDIVDILLEGKVQETAAAAETSSETSYRVVVKDEDGNPVKGVTVQFCDDNSCLVGKTDADGVASFDVAEALYTVHILKVPAGYEKDSNEYVTKTTYSTVEVKLQKSK
ncbi:MAG: redoxin domain-containing protein [Sphaerochaetaceae bacterium]|nr:redoxin domain-containing protein [Sphaerochaetaceae bacterium]